MPVKFPHKIHYFSLPVTELFVVLLYIAEWFLSTPGMIELEEKKKSKTMKAA